MYIYRRLRVHIRYVTFWSFWFHFNYWFKIHMRSFYQNPVCHIPIYCPLVTEIKTTYLHHVES